MPLSPRVRKLLYGLLAVVGLGGLARGCPPDPAAVEVATVGRGPLEVTVDEDGETRAHDRYVISAPVAGRLARLELHAGDDVQPDQTVARLWPIPLSARERDEQRARISAAEALVLEGQERVRHAAADHQQAARERQRVERLVLAGSISSRDAEEVRLQEATSANELQAARFRARATAADAQAARAALLASDAARGTTPAALAVRSPIEGRVLRIPDPSERVVDAGAPLLVVGNPARLEVVIDVLSTDAVKVRPGMQVRLEGWGGDHPLRALLRVVEPQAFTRVSALGVEEQRVNVIADLVDAPGPLGDAFRVEARIVLWGEEDVLKAPISALFRNGDDWSVFVLEGGRTRRREIQIGHRGALEVEVLKGLRVGERVVRHPSNDVADGRRVRVVT